MRNPRQYRRGSWLDGQHFLSARWSPGSPKPSDYLPSSVSALERHAAEAARRGVYAPERRKEAA
jgi:hypothetical protein